MRAIQAVEVFDLGADPVATHACKAMVPFISRGLSPSGRFATESLLRPDGKAGGNRNPDGHGNRSKKGVRCMLMDSFPRAMAAAMALVALVGCIAPPDISQRNDIAEADRLVATEVAARVKADCRYERTIGGMKQREPKFSKFESPARIERLFRSDTGWYKANFSADGLDGIAFYHPRTRAFVCGEEIWQRLSSSKGVKFVEVGTK